MESQVSERGRLRAPRRSVPLCAWLLGLAAAAVLLSPATALALSGDSSSGDAAAAQYTHTSVAASGLPFTGYAIAAVLVVALVLLSVGAAVRRSTRPSAD